MPYSRSRKFTPRKRTTRRFKRRGGGGNLWSTASQALRLATKVAGIVNTEYKVFDAQSSLAALGIVNNAAPATNGFTSFLPITTMALGDEMNQRNGRSVRMKSLQLRFNPTLGATLDHVVIRIILLRWKGGEGTVAPAMSDVYVQPPTVAKDWVRAYRNVMNSNTDNFQIHWDKRFTLDKDFKSEIQIDKYFKLDYHIKFRNTYDQNQFFVAIMYDNVATDGTFDMPMQTRVRYIDN